MDSQQMGYAYPPSPTQQQGGYPPTQQQGGYPPTQQQGGYPSAQQQGGYPPAHQQGGYPPTQQQGGNIPMTTGQQWQPGQEGGASLDNVPSEPPDDDDNAQDEDYKPTSLQGLAEIEGYGKIGFESMGNLPPPPPPPPTYEEPPKLEFGTGANISGDEAREALLQKVAEHCCWGKRAAESMKFNEITPTDALHYQLETFCEGRTSARTEVPYRGGRIDGPENGLPPLPWNIPCSPTSGLFVDQRYLIPVPHTDIIRECGACGGLGWRRCFRCHGCGRVRCSSCGGRGHRTVYRDGHHEHRTCFMCHGSGRRVCRTCGGDGRVTCSHCQGYRLVKNFVQLTVTFTNHISEYILERTDMPDMLVKTVSGVELFSQTLQQVAPVVAFPVKEVNDNSVRLVEAHKGAFPSERQLQQRQTLRAVPVTEIAYKWKNENLYFWVYGQERKVYSPDYPHQCCWGCNIL